MENIFTYLIKNYYNVYVSSDRDNTSITISMSSVSNDESEYNSLIELLSRYDSRLNECKSHNNKYNIVGRREMEEIMTKELTNGNKLELEFFGLRSIAIVFTINDINEVVQKEYKQFLMKQKLNDIDRVGK